MLLRYCHPDFKTNETKNILENTQMSLIVLFDPCAETLDYF